MWRKLQSKDVVKLMGIGAEDLTSIPAIRKSFFIVCEHLNGPTLRGIVQKQSFCTKKDVYSTKDVFRHAPAPTSMPQSLMWVGDRAELLGQTP